MSIVFATQLTAVATLALAVFAFATAVLALMAWRKQSREVRDQGEMLRLQAGEFRQLAAEREREAAERRRAQAVLVYTWVARQDKDTMVAHMRNTSQQPVYEVALHGAPEGATTRWMEPLMPGQEVSHVIPEGTDRVTFTFRDRADIRWEAWPNGQLHELRPPPASTPQQPSQ